MNSEPNVQRAPRAAVLSRLALAAALAVVLVGCGKDDAAAPTTGAQTGATKPAATAQTVISEKVSAMSPAQLREMATKAYNENRLYAPAGDNAIEYYLALRDKSPGDAAVSSALEDLLPMAVIATEQSITRDDFSEAQRLSALIEKADKEHPALSRLKSSVVAQQQAASQRAVQQQLTAEEQAKKQIELEKKRLEDQKKQQELAARQLEQKEAAERTAATDRGAAERRAAAEAAAAAERQAAERRAAEAAAAQRAAAAPTPAPSRPAPSAPAAAARSGDLRALSTPAPDFPAEALRTAQSGEVQVEFTVDSTGLVSAARVVRSTPPRLFDRAALNAVKRWRFAPIDSPTTVRRTIAFNPGT